MKEKGFIYMDWASSASPNAGAIHALGIQAKEKLEKNRKEVADFLGAKKENIIFTSGATESNNLAICGIVLSWHKNKKKKGLPHIITTNIEHVSVLETFKMLSDRKLATISIIPVEANGIIDSKKIEKEICKDTILVSVMYTNNEIGTIQPIREVAKTIRRFRKNNRTVFPFFHIDAVQAVNYFDLKVEKLGVDLLSISGSKIEKGGGAGILYRRKNVPLDKIFAGGDQEMGLRPGTENLAEIAKLAKALRVVEKTREKEYERIIKLRDYFFKKLKDSPYLKKFGIIVNGDIKERLPNNVNITFPKIPSDLLVLELSARGIYVSEKSACKSKEKKGSYVIEAIREAQKSKIKDVGSVRFSFGKSTKKEDIDYTIKSITEILRKLEKWYN